MININLSTMKNKTEKQTRHLTIQGDLYDLSFPRKYVPKIILKGLWLDEAGFRSYLKVQVEVKLGELVLRPVE